MFFSLFLACCFGYSFRMATFSLISDRGSRETCFVVPGKGDVL